MDLCTGDIFGEDKLFFNIRNRFTVKITSIKATIVSIPASDLEKNFHRAWPEMTKQFKNRNIVIEHQL